MNEPDIPSRGTPLHQINDADLGELERVLPQIVDRLYDRMDNRLRTQIRTVQRILSDVRWNYGPPHNVHVIPADGDLPPGDQPA
jgi:hypothetical protein